MLYYSNEDGDDDDDGDGDGDDDVVNRLSNNPRDQLEAFYVFCRFWNRLSSGDIGLQQRL
jgi:hypothetical protein